MKLGIGKIARGLLLVPAMVLGLNFFVPTVGAAEVDCVADPMQIECGVQSAQGKNQPASLFGTDGENGVFRAIVNIMLFIVGAVAVIMLIVGGIRYVISSGDQNQVTAAKNTILYAIVGIVVAVLAFAVVSFVLGGLNPSTT